MSTTISFPAFEAATNSITLRNAHLGSLEASQRKVRPMLMSDSTIRTFTSKRHGKLVDFTFSLYCKDDYIDAVNFFLAFNGQYLDINGDKLQLLDKEVQVEEISQSEWQFSITGLLF